MSSMLVHLALAAALALGPTLGQERRPAPNQQAPAKASLVAQFITCTPTTIRLSNGQQLDSKNQIADALSRCGPLSCGLRPLQRAAGIHQLLHQVLPHAGRQRRIGRTP